MRVSIKKDSYYWHPLAKIYRVFLNDKLLDLCFEADDDLNIAYCYKRNKNGELYLSSPNPDNDQIAETTVSGNIFIYNRSTNKIYNNFRFQIFKHKILFNLKECYGFLLL